MFTSIIIGSGTDRRVINRIGSFDSKQDKRERQWAANGIKRVLGLA